MVQVDIIWGYAFGATFAAGAARQLKKERQPFNNKYYVHVLLFLSIFFAPSGLYLLWQFPHWETMQVAWRHSDLPAWLVVLFAVTNITQGILGYWVGYKLIRSGNFYGAHLNWIISWILFWSVLVMGWDTTGWQRFLYDPTENNMVPWTPGTHMGVWFFTSNVWITLVVMGTLFFPMIYPSIARWMVDGIDSDPSIIKAKNSLINFFVFMALLLFGTFGMTIGLAIVSGLIVFLFRDLTGSVFLGYIIGLPLFWSASYILLFRKGRPIHRYAKQLFLQEPLETVTANQMQPNKHLPTVPGSGIASYETVKEGLPSSDDRAKSVT